MTQDISQALALRIPCLYTPSRSCTAQDERLLSPAVHAVGITTYVVEPHLVVCTARLGLEKHGLASLAPRARVVVGAGQCGVLGTQ